MLLADVVKDYSASLLADAASLDVATLWARLYPLLLRAEDDLSSEGFAKKEITLNGALAMRYKGQAFEIDVPLELASLAGREADRQALEAIVRAFHQRHERLYGYSRPERAAEVVQLRLRAVVRTANKVVNSMRPAFTREVGRLPCDPLCGPPDLRTQPSYTGMSWSPG